MLEGLITVALLGALVVASIFLIYVGGGWLAKSITPKSWWDGAPLKPSEREAAGALAEQITEEMVGLMRIFAWGSNVPSSSRPFIRDGWEYRNNLLNLTKGGSPYREACSEAERWLAFAGTVVAKRQAEPFTSILGSVLSEPSPEELANWVRTGRFPNRWAGELKGP
jgi:hypothetical protein